MQWLIIRALLAAVALTKVFYNANDQIIFWALFIADIDNLFFQEFLIVYF